MTGVQNYRRSETQQIATPISVAQHLPRFLSLVPRHAKHLDPRLKSLASLALVEADDALRPASTDEFRTQLTACLALTSPSGMSEQDRTEWLRAAWGTLRDIPSDLLLRGCDVARRWCDHPSKIVPAILREIEPVWNRRKANRRDVADALAKMEPEPEPEDDWDPERAAEILRGLGAQPESATTAPSHRGPPEKPDRAWYLARGIDPDETA